MEAAKLYFNRELFATTKAPTAAKLQEFLQDNENALRDLGLYDEFSTVEGAKKAIEGTIRVAPSGSGGRVPRLRRKLGPCINLYRR